MKCYIPARSGSKGLKDKNIRNLAGTPLLVYTIKAALNSGLFKHENIIVSTDSQIYADLALAQGVAVSMRQDHLAKDTTTTYELLEDILSKDDMVDDFILLQPTSPFRSAQHVVAALEMYRESKADSLISITKLEKSANLLTRIDNQHRILDIVGIDKGYSRQSKVSQTLYYPNGAIFISNKTSYLQNKSFYLDTTVTFLMDQYCSIDIDSLDDFEYAEYLLSRGKIK